MGAAAAGFRSSDSPPTGGHPSPHGTAYAPTTKKATASTARTTRESTAAPRDAAASAPYVSALTPRAKYVSGESATNGSNQSGSSDEVRNVSERKSRGSARALLAAMTPSCESATRPRIAPTPQNSVRERDERDEKQRRRSKRHAQAGDDDDEHEQNERREADDDDVDERLCEQPLQASERRRR